MEKYKQNVLMDDEISLLPLKNGSAYIIDDVSSSNVVIHFNCRSMIRESSSSSLT